MNNTKNARRNPDKNTVSSSNWKKIIKRRIMRNRIVLALTIILVFSSLVFGHIIRVKADSKNDYKYKYFITVQVNYGDTLTMIANTYYTDAYDNLDDMISEICKINKISGDHIIAGTDLIIPYYSNEALPYIGLEI